MEPGLALGLAQGYPEPPWRIPRLKTVYQGGTWTAAYGKDLQALEREWLEFLRGQ